MKNLLLFFIVAVIFSSCTTELGENNILTASGSEKSKSLAIMIDTTLTRQEISQVMALTGALSADGDGNSIPAINLIRLNKISKEVSEIKTLLATKTTNSTPVIINAEMVKEWMKKNPKNAKEIVRDLLKENVFD